MRDYQVGTVTIFCTVLVFLHTTVQEYELPRVCPHMLYLHIFIQRFFENVHFVPILGVGKRGTY